MAEIRCPMCGKLNPDNLDVCQFCEARLKPLTASLPSDAVPPDGTDGLQAPEQPEPSSDLPDWLDFDTDAKLEEGDDTALSDAAPFDDGDDWLTRLENDPESKDVSPLQPGAEPDVEKHATASMDFNNLGVPDWMEDIEETRSSQPLEQSPETDDGEFPTQLADDDESDPTAGLLDWLSDSGGEDKDASIRPAEEIDIPDWLTASEDQPTVQLQEGNEEITRPDRAFYLEGEDAQSKIPATDDDKTEFTSGYVNQETIPIQDFQGDSGLPNWLESEDDGAVESNLPDAESELPDWFSDLGGEETVDDSVRGVTDWLSGGRAEEVETVLFSTDDELADGLSGEEVGETESAIPDAESELPDWLSELGGEETTEPDVAAPEQTPIPVIAPDSRVTGVTDWLTDGSAEEVDSVLSAAEDEFFDGLSGEEVGETESVLPATEGELPDWLSDEDDNAVESTLPAAEGEPPDWLSILGGEETAELDEAIPVQASTPAFTSDDDEELPDWLSDGDAEEVEGALPAVEGELPDWLSDLGGEETTEPDVAIPAQASAPAFTGDDEEELPELLSDGDKEEVESTFPSTEGELPDWLSDLDGEETAESNEAVPAQASTPAFTSDDDEELPDWLSDGGVEEVESSLPSAEAELPGWLSDLEDEETAEPKEAATAKASVPAFTADDEEELPDWLSDISGEETTGQDDIAETGIPTFATTDELPGWLSEIDDIEIELPEETLEEVEPDIQSSTADESRAVPSWLHEIEEYPAGEGSAGEGPAGDTLETEPTEAVSISLEDEFDDELSEFDQLPEWLSDSSQTDADQVQEITGPVDDIAPAELPGWLAAMRPVESAVPDVGSIEQSSPLESSGPLAGLYGVLASEPEIAQLKKPPVYSNKLQVTEAQQSHAALLRDLLQTEGKPQAMPLPSLISRQRVFHLILGIILIVIAFIAVMASGDMVAMPSADVIPSGVEQTYQIVTALSSEDTALVAFDYEPGLVGEMDAASAAVVDNMMEKGAKLVLVSTSPTGPALAERFINDVQGNHQYNSSTQYVNLGYIPGGISGLAAFAQNPSRVAPTTLDGTQAWETEPLKTIQSVSDFALVLLITDNPTTTRAWVEQVNPYLEPVPLVAVVSAQVEPIARTYHGQIDGLISGLTGGAAYEVLGGSNLAREQWDAFNIILIVAVSAILIGGVISVGSTMIAQRKENDGGSV